MTRFFHRMVRIKEKQKAAVTTARKLLKVIYALLKEERALLKEEREFQTFQD